MAKNHTKGIITKKEQPVKKEYGYEKDGVQLNFTLRVDIKKEMSAFMALMNSAAEDIAKDLAALDSKHDGK